MIRMMSHWVSTLPAQPFRAASHQVKVTSRPLFGIDGGRKVTFAKVSTTPRDRAKVGDVLAKLGDG